jgi:PIN domain nuclease of toxin-antitoxin system
LGNSNKNFITKLFLEIEFEELYEYLQKNEIEILDINLNNTKILINLKFIHRDPFDRMIIAQAMSEQMILITKDENIQLYKEIQTLW